MQLTEQQRAEFRELALPLIQFLQNNCHPHVSALIDNQSAELLEGVVAFTDPPPSQKGE